MSEKQEKYCVLGATSFGGRATIESLLKEKHEVLAIARRETPKKPFTINNYGSKKLNWIVADIVTDTKKIISSINKFKPDYIIDFMGQGMVAQSWESPNQWYNTNIAKKSEMLKGLNWKEFLKLYVRISTPEVFGSVDGIITENKSFNPSTPYALSHATIDQHIKLMANQTNFPFIIARYANFYGPGQQLYRIVPKAAFFALTNKMLTLDGGGISERAFIYKDDISSSLNALIANGKIGESYHFSDTDCVSIRQVVQQIAECCGIEFKNFTKNGAERTGKDQRYFMDINKAKTELGWKPKVSLENGISETVEWVTKSLNCINPHLLNYHHIYRESYE